MIKKGDILIISALCIASFLLCLGLLFFKGEGQRVIIKQDNAVIYEGALNKNKTVKLRGNTVVIKDGFCFVSEADCPDKICKNHKKISGKGESIICLPNRASAEIK